MFGIALGVLVKSHRADRIHPVTMDPSMLIIEPDGVRMLGQPLAHRHSPRVAIGW